MLKYSVATLWLARNLIKGRFINRRRFLKFGGAGVAGLAGVSGLGRWLSNNGAGPAPVEAQTQSPNQITAENAQPGTTNWQLINPSTNNGRQIKGYASATSVNKGGSIDLFVSVNTAQTYKLEVFRTGWYGGTGGRLMKTVTGLNGTTQPIPALDSYGMVACKWAKAYTLSIPTSWVTGQYLVKLTNARGYDNYIHFVVRDDAATADFLFQASVTTYHAYNPFGGKSLYTYNSSNSKAAVKVSLDRPYADDGAGDFYAWEMPMVHFLEKNGYNLKYCTNLDIHTTPSMLSGLKGFLSVGHDEYWTRQMYDSVLAARDAGVNLAFFGANTDYWQIRFESSASGVPNRVIVGYKDTADKDPLYNVNNSLLTCLWRDDPVSRPENQLVGVMYDSYRDGAVGQDYIVNNSNHWVYNGSGFSNGSKVTGIVGYEWDKRFANGLEPNGLVQLSNSPVTDFAGITSTSNASIYQAASGAWVFATGSMYWAYGCDFTGYQTTSLVNSGIQTVTLNVLNKFLASSTPNPTPTATATATATTVATTVATATATATPTKTPTPTATATATATVISSPTPTPTPPPTPPANQISQENALAGTSSWQLDLWASDTNMEIKGYASATSVNKGGSVDLFVTVNPPQTYTIEVYRIGWYAGAGGRLLSTVGPLSGTTQAVPAPDSYGTVACNWTKSYTLNIPTSWVTGQYLLKLINANGYQNYILLTVRDDTATADLLFQSCANTFQAYNAFGGKSLYSYSSNDGIAAVKVSFDRPYSDSGSGYFLRWELGMVRFLEKSGYNVTYCTDVDMHTNPALLNNRKGLVVVGHNEYTTRPMYDNLLAARNRGVHLGFFGADNYYWQARLENSASGAANRVLVCYRYAYASDPLYGNNNNLVTTQWRDPLLNRAENQLVGVMFDSAYNWEQGYPFVVSNNSHWVYDGTGFANGDAVPGLVGYEWDTRSNNGLEPSGLVTLGTSPVIDTSNVSSVANATIYQAASGAWVFGAGSIYWVYGCDYNPFNTRDLRNSGIQRATFNILNKFVGSIVALTSQSLAQPGVYEPALAGAGVATPPASDTFTTPHPGQH